MRPTIPPTTSTGAGSSPDDGGADALPRTDPPRDGRLGEALRRIDAPSAAELDRLRATIVAAARARLSALRARAWWEWTASWASAAIPLALAAGIIALVFAARAGRGSADLPATTVATSVATPTYSPAFISVVSQPGAGAQVTDAVVGPPSHDWLLTQVVQP